MSIEIQLMLKINDPTDGRTIIQRIKLTI